MTKDLLDRVEPPCRRALTDAGLAASDIEDVLLVGGMTRWPAVQETVERLFGRKPSKGANPDEVVALGAAGYAGILAGDSDEAALLDVTPHDLGIKVGDSGFSVMIPRNSMLPVRARKLFATTSTDQKFVSIDVYQGESNDLSKNRKLGQVVLDDLPPGPPGSVRVELVMTVDVESLLSVTARELRTGKETSITIRPSGGLSQREIVEIINRRRNENSIVGRLPAEGGNIVRVATREQAVRSSRRPRRAPTTSRRRRRVDPAVLKVADAVGALIESWGFKRNMGRMWAVLYLEDHPLSAADLGERLGLSTGSVSMLLAELLQWGIVKKAWVVGERREHYEAETSLWKMISRVFRERELNWVKTAVDAFATARDELRPGNDARRKLIAERIASLTQLAQVGAHLLESMLQGEAVDSLSNT